MKNMNMNERIIQKEEKRLTKLLKLAKIELDKAGHADSPPQTIKHLKQRAEALQNRLDRLTKVKDAEGKSLTEDTAESPCGKKVAKKKK